MKSKNSCQWVCFSIVILFIVGCSNVVDEAIEKGRRQAPIEISGQAVLSTNEDVAITLTLSDFSVKDPRRLYPNGFTLSVVAPEAGAMYTSKGETIIPKKDYNGELTVPVIVNNGIKNSNVYNAVITVMYTMQ